MLPLTESGRFLLKQDTNTDTLANRIPTGMLATLGMGMSLRDTALVTLFFALLTCIPPAFMGIGGMETGLRQLVQARYSFGCVHGILAHPIRNMPLLPANSLTSLYLVTAPLLLNAATLTGFSLLSSVVGGQALASLDPDSVSVNVGIVIACLISFAVSLLGFKALHFWERWTWIPNLISIVIAVGCGGKYLHLQSETEPAKPSQVLTFGCLIAGYFITFGGTVSDYSIYHNPRRASRYDTSSFLDTVLKAKLTNISLHHDQDQNFPLHLRRPPRPIGAPPHPRGRHRRCSP